MIGAIIGGAAGLLGTGINAWLGGRENRRQRRELDRQERENESWYNRRYNELGRERSNFRRAMEALRESGRIRLNTERGRNAVVGGSTGAVSGAKIENAAREGAYLANAATAQESLRDKIESQYLNRKDQIRSAKNNLSMARQANLANAATQASKIGAGIASSVWSDGHSSESVGDNKNSVSSSSNSLDDIYDAPYDEYDENQNLYG